ncbi:MAG: hypothetical protein PUC77_02840, partial [Bacteroidales bacterium]|nr:hypothetical protein [Bacteroidales bacterium]
LNWSFLLFFSVLSFFRQKTKAKVNKKVGKTNIRKRVFAEIMPRSRLFDNLSVNNAGHLLQKIRANVDFSTLFT